MAPARVGQVINRRVGKVHRKLRQRARLTQKALADRCGVPRWKIGRIEAELFDALRVGEVERSLAALGAELEVRVTYRGVQAERLLDELHARLAAHIVELLLRDGWDARVEVTFAEWGERGSYDVLAWHPSDKVLLVIEIKSELASVEGTLRPMDVKVRLARKVAEDRFGWRARHVACLLVLPEDRSARRAVDRHTHVLRSRLPATSREVRSWLRSLGAAIAGIWFVSAPGGRAWPRNPSSVQRVRVTQRDETLDAGRGVGVPASAADPAFVTVRRP